MDIKRYATIACGIMLSACLTGGTALANPLDVGGPTVWDAKFMSRAMALARTEIDESSAVLRRSHDSKSRRYAYAMGRAWSYTYSQLKAMAIDKGLPAEAPPVRIARQQMGPLMGRMSQARGARIEADYARDQVRLQREAIRLFWDEAKGTGDRYIRNLATVTVPQLRSRLAFARRFSQG